MSRSPKADREMRMVTVLQREVAIGHLVSLVTTHSQALLVLAEAALVLLVTPLPYLHPHPLHPDAPPFLGVATVVVIVRAMG